MTHQELIERAKAVLGEFQLAELGLTAGSASCALMTIKGTIYTGRCLDLACGIGFCAKHAAIAEMLKARETVIDYIVAVSSKRIMMLCGRRRPQGAGQSGPTLGLSALGRFRSKIYLSFIVYTLVLRDAYKGKR
ncbi:MAG: hypothetical protein JOZ78_02845 [Chroococcidiopsidaceae cyanobacterium CP_BM_ER_R8_30]|nr:hypothetical protein [Chroococcidiopsidaceae cyanobacterium CP_BM_ER_R8_30]